MLSPSPHQSVPGGNVVITSANDDVRLGFSQGGSDACVKEEIMPSSPPSIRRKNLPAKLDFVLINQPVTRFGISFRKENNMQINPVNSGQAIENRDAIRGDDFGEDR